MSKKAQTKDLEIIIQILEGLYPEKRSKKKPGILDTLIATKLSQNTTDKTAAIAFGNLKRQFKYWNEAASASPALLKKLIKPCGLTNTKATDIRVMLNNIIKKHGNTDMKHLNKLSNDEIYSELTGYKGIGVKTASCVMAFALGREVFPVDTHIHRILNRIGIVRTKTPEETHNASEKIIPDKKKLGFHRNLIKFGRNVCKAQKPLCGVCALYDYCGFNEKENYYEIKQKGKENNFIILDSI